MYVHVRIYVYRYMYVSVFSFRGGKPMFPELGGRGGGCSLELKYTNQCSASSAFHTKLQLSHIMSSLALKSQHYWSPLSTSSAFQSFV